MSRIPAVPPEQGQKPDTPGTPTATAGNTQATVAFTESAYKGKSGTGTYTATSNPGSITGTNSTTPITVTGLTNGTAYTFTVKYTTSTGVDSDTTAASNSITPVLPPYFPPFFPPFFPPYFPPFFPPFFPPYFPPSFPLPSCNCQNGSTGTRACGYVCIPGSGWCPGCNASNPCRLGYEYYTLTNCSGQPAPCDCPACGDTVVLSGCGDAGSSCTPCP